MEHSSVIEISKSALKNNIQFLKKTIGKDCQISSVVKANAYGHGLNPFSQLVEEAGINHFSVFSADEAYHLQQHLSPDSTIMIMGSIADKQLPWAIENDIEFFVFELQRVKAALAAAKKIGKPAGLHLELETGMNRTGFVNGELKRLIPLLHDNEEHLKPVGVCTHYAGAESIANYRRVKDQIGRFRKLRNWLAKQGIKPEISHTACSAASMGYPETRMDMVRIGIMQYGFWPSKETQIKFMSKQKEPTDPLERIISWKSHVMSVKQVKTGEFIGYGTSYMADRDMTIATVPVGYGYGYARSLSNQGRVLVRGRRTGVIGIVNMNSMVIDITEMPEVERGDEVVLIGKQGDNSVTVASFGELSTQLNYELLTRLPRDTPRVIVD